MKFKLTEIDRFEFNKLVDVKETNISLADLFLDYVNGCNADYNEETIKSLTGNTLKDKFFNGFLDSMEIDLTNKENSSIAKNYIYPGLSFLDIDKYLSNEYLKNIKIEPFKEKNFELTSLYYEPYEGFIFDDITVEQSFNYKEITNVGFFNKQYVFPALLEDNKIWMSINPNEINTMKKAIDEANGKVLVLGLGLGYFAYMVSLKENVNKVVIIENNALVIDIFKKNIFNQFKNKEKIELIQDDAFAYLEKNKNSDFNYVYVDLWHNPNDGLESYLKVKKYEKELNNIHFEYWLETGLIALLRRCLISLIEEEIEGSKDDNYLNSEIFTDTVINKLHFLLKDFEINSFSDIKKLLSDSSLKSLASKI